MDFALATLIVTGIGTIAGMAIYLDRKWGRRRKLTVKMKYGYSTAPNGARYIIVTVSNPSEIASTVSSVSIGPGKDWMFFPPSDVVGCEKLPLDLDPGKSHSFMYDYEIIKKSLVEHGSQMRISALCSDALDNQYKSKSIAIT